VVPFPHFLEQRRFLVRAEAPQGVKVHEAFQDTLLGEPAAGFFAFHILLAYLADVVNIHPAFWISASVSVLLVVTYMRLVAGVKFALAYTGLAQLVYLVGFSYAFFWVGRTGLTITICAVVTLFVLMQATGRVNWHEFFRRPARPVVIPPPAAGSETPNGAPS